MASFRALCEIALQHRSQPVRECVDFTPLRLQIQLQLAHTVGQVHATSMVPLGRLGGGPLDQADSVDSRVQLRLVARQVSGFGNNKRTTKFTRVWHVPDLQVAAHNTPLSNLLGDVSVWLVKNLFQYLCSDLRFHEILSSMPLPLYG